MRPKDVLGLLYLLAVSAFLVGETDLFVSLTRAHPYAMGFAKFAVLATFGECLKTRIATSNWLPDKLVARFAIWGIFGLWITAAFPFVDGGVKSLAVNGLWLKTWPAFWMSAWANFLGGYGFFMMLSHYWADSVLAHGFQWPWQVLGKPETARWAKIVIVSLFVFWMPIHTFTFSLAPVWRVVFAAYLSICLGLILSFAVRRR